MALTTLIIPVWNRHDVLKTCLESLAQYTDKDKLRIICVDNDSDGKTKKYLETAKKLYKNLIVITNPKNMGYLGGINTGLMRLENKELQSDYIIFGNSDIAVENNWLESLEKHFDENEKLGAIGPVSDAVAGLQQAKLNDRFGNGLQITDRYLIGFFMMVRASIVKEIGMLDVRFGLGFSEDIDYSIRIVQAGWHLGIARDVYVYHVGSASYELLHNTEAYAKDLDTKHKLLVAKWGNEVIDKIFNIEIYNGTVAFTGGEMVPSEFAYCYFHMLNTQKQWLYQYAMKNNFIPAAWNKALENMKGEWILLIDSKHVFSSDILESIQAMNEECVVFLQEGGKDIAAMYITKKAIDQLEFPVVMYDKKGLWKHVEEKLQEAKVNYKVIGEDIGFFTSYKDGFLPMIDEPKNPFGTIGVPMMENVHYEFVASLAGVLINKQEEMKLVMPICKEISDARNEIVENREGNWVWFIDSDHIFAPDTLNRLRARKLAICGAIAYTKKPPFVPCIYAERGGDGKHHAVLYPWPMDRPFEVGMTGTGCILINNKVFEDVTAPWFEYNKDMGEDMYFLTRAKEKGHHIIVDPTIPLGHMTSMPVDFELFISTNYPHLVPGLRRG